EDVLREGIEPNAYAESILRICELYLESPLPFACGITASNLKQRIEAIMTAHAAPRLTLARKAVLALAGCVALASPFVAGLVAQTTPARDPALRAVWTPASVAPKNLLTVVQARNHDSFIDRARAGNIDLVFFGTTDTAMW